MILHVSLEVYLGAGVSEIVWSKLDLMTTIYIQLF